MAEAHDYDLHLAAIAVLALRSGKILEPKEKQFLLETLGTEVDQSTASLLVRELDRYIPTADAERVLHMIVAMRDGFLRAARDGPD